MKKFLTAALFSVLFSHGMAFAAPRYVQSEVDNTSTKYNGQIQDIDSVNLSTSAWTALPAIANVNDRRQFVFVLNYTTNNAVQKFIITDSTITPTVSIGPAMFELSPGETFQGNLGPTEYMWGVSRHTSAESSCATEGYY